MYLLFLSLNTYSKLNYKMNLPKGVVLEIGPFQIPQLTYNMTLVQVHLLESDKSLDHQASLVSYYSRCSQLVHLVPVKMNEMI